MQFIIKQYMIKLCKLIPENLSNFPFNTEVER